MAFCKPVEGLKINKQPLCYPTVPKKWRAAMRYASDEIPRTHDYHGVMDNVRSIYGIRDMAEFEDLYKYRAAQGLRIANESRLPKKPKYYWVLGFDTHSGVGNPCKSAYTIREMYSHLETRVLEAYSDENFADKYLQWQETKKPDGSCCFRWFQVCDFKAFNSERAARKYDPKLSPTELFDRLKELFPNNHDDTNEQITLFDFGGNK